MDGIQDLGKQGNARILATVQRYTAEGWINEPGLVYLDAEDVERRGFAVVAHSLGYSIAGDGGPWRGQRLLTRYTTWPRR